MRLEAVHRLLEKMEPRSLGPCVPSIIQQLDGDDISVWPVALLLLARVPLAARNHMEKIVSLATFLIGEQREERVREFLGDTDPRADWQELRCSIQLAGLELMEKLSRTGDPSVAKFFSRHADVIAVLVDDGHPFVRQRALHVLSTMEPRALGAHADVRRAGFEPSRLKPSESEPRTQSVLALSRTLRLEFASSWLTGFGSHR